MNPKDDVLVPAIIQDIRTRDVLMLGYMNAESLKRTQETGKVTFFSRSRQSIWVKGETSGNYLNVVEIQEDCDRDALLIRVDPTGPTCHRLTPSCFDQELAFLQQLGETIQNRLAPNSTPKLPGSDLHESYVRKLASAGLDRVAQKVGEEAVETVIAAKNGEQGPLENEAADLLFHLMVLLQYKGSSLGRVVRRLEKRHGVGPNPKQGRTEVV